MTTSSKRQRLAAHGAEIPVLGLGTWDLRGASCAQMVEQALRIGYRHIDTAQAYDNEREVGEGLRVSGCQRSAVFITTKVWWTDVGERRMERAVKQSLSRLALSEVDLLLQHWPNPEVPLEESLGGLARMKSLGLARHIGVSNFTVALLEEAVRSCPQPLLTNQIEYHPYLDQAKVIAACRRHGVAVTAYSPLARGCVASDPLLMQIGKRHGKSATQVCLRWLIQQQVIAIPRTASRERLRQNFEVFDFVLDEAELRAIAGLARKDGRQINVSWAPRWD